MELRWMLRAATSKNGLFAERHQSRVFDQSIVFLENSLEFFQCFSRLSQEILAFFASLVVFLLFMYRYEMLTMMSIDILTAQMTTTMATTMMMLMMMMMMMSRWIKRGNNVLLMVTCGHICYWKGSAMGDVNCFYLNLNHSHNKRISSDRAIVMLNVKCNIDRFRFWNVFSFPIGSVLTWMAFMDDSNTSRKIVDLRKQTCLT